MAEKKHFCMSCGKGIPERAKFCPYCGENTQVETVEEIKAEELRKEEPKKEAVVQADSQFNLLSPGDTYYGYEILKMLNKDSLGIKYIAKKDDRELLLKIYYKSSFHNVDVLVSLLMQLGRVEKIKDTHLPQVIEIVNDKDKTYTVVEFVHGVSLADIKKYSPEKLSEEYVREIVLSLIKTAINIRDAGLSVSKIAATGVMIRDDGQPVILLSGISYEEHDLNADVFAIGKLIARLMAPDHVQPLYTDERLREFKFIPVPGLTVALNRVLADCLHRTILNRFSSLEKMHDAIKALPPVEGAPVSKMPTNALEDVKKSVAQPPKQGIEYGFWLLIIVIVAIVAMLFTTNISSIILGTGEQKLQYTGLGIIPRDSLSNGENERSQPRDRQRIAPTLTKYGELKANSRRTTTDRNTAEITIPAQQSKEPGQQQNKPSATDFVYIEPGIFSFGRLDEKAIQNVSISGFYIAKKEVTQAEWKRFMKPANVSTVGNSLPVDNVSWFDIAIYCNGLSNAEGLEPAYHIRGLGANRVVTCNFEANGYRLPTEAEWEYAAKAGKLYNYSGSDNAESVAWYRANAMGSLQLPAGKSPNAYGVYDMTGNVSEWVWDWYSTNLNAAINSFVNPGGPETGTQKSIRGGNVQNAEGKYLNILWREKGDPNKGYPFVGFRLVRTK